MKTALLPLRTRVKRLIFKPLDGKIHTFYLYFEDIQVAVSQNNEIILDRAYNPKLERYQKFGKVDEYEDNLLDKCVNFNRISNPFISTDYYGIFDIIIDEFDKMVVNFL